MADVRRLAIEDTDAIIGAFCDNLQSAAENPLVGGLTMAEKKEMARKEVELNMEPEKQKLDETVSLQAQSS